MTATIRFRRCRGVVRNADVFRPRNRLLPTHAAVQKRRLDLGSVAGSVWWLASTSDLRCVGLGGQAVKASTFASRYLLPSSICVRCTSRKRERLVQCISRLLGESSVNAAAAHLVAPAQEPGAVGGPVFRFCENLQNPHGFEMLCKALLLLGKRKRVAYSCKEREKKKGKG